MEVEGKFLWVLSDFEGKCPGFERFWVGFDAFWVGFGRFLVGFELGAPELR